MSNKKILYFSVDKQRVEDFNTWAKKMRPIEWIDKGFIEPTMDDLPQIISEQVDKALLCVILSKQTNESTLSFKYPANILCL